VGTYTVRKNRGFKAQNGVDGKEIIKRFPPSVLGRTLPIRVPLCTEDAASLALPSGEWTIVEIMLGDEAGFISMFQK
jgi:hypothetical protein